LVKKFQTIVSNRSEARISQLKIGNATIEPIHTINSAFNNRDRIKYHHKKVLNKSSGKSTLANIINFSETDPRDFVKSSCFSGSTPHMIVQDEDMKSLLQQRYSCFETDYVEGLIQEIGMHRNINIKFTSGFDPILNRWVPLCISFLFGKKEDDYKVHWDYIFSVMNYDSWFDFKDCFPGNVCDMSDALGKYFFYSIKKYIQEKFQVMPRDDFLYEIFGFCKVHFERSKRRVGKNRDIIERDNEQEFNDMVDGLFQVQ
jgi:hypothetical protein